MKSAIIAAIVLSISADSVNRWREDLNFLEKEIPRVHDNAFHTIKPEAYASMFDNLRARLPAMTENQIAVEVAIP